MVNMPIKSMQTKQYAKLSWYQGGKCYISMTLQIEGVSHTCLLVSDNTHVYIRSLSFPQIIIGV